MRTKRANENKWPDYKLPETEVVTEESQQEYEETMQITGSPEEGKKNQEVTKLSNRKEEVQKVTPTTRKEGRKVAYEDQRS